MIRFYDLKLLKEDTLFDNSQNFVTMQDYVKLLNEIEHLKTRLDEYKLLEIDIANMRKFQQENEKLKEVLEFYADTYFWSDEDTFAVSWGKNTTLHGSDLARQTLKELEEQHE